MSWKNLPYWLRGGIITGMLFGVTFVVRELIRQSNNPSNGGITSALSILSIVATFIYFAFWSFIPGAIIGYGIGKKSIFITIAPIFV